MGLKPTIPVFERAKTVHALDRTTTFVDTTFHISKWKYQYLEKRYDILNQKKKSHSFVTYVHIQCSCCMSANHNSFLWQSETPELYSHRYVILFIKSSSLLHAISYRTLLGLEVSETFICICTLRSIVKRVTDVLIWISVVTPETVYEFSGLCIRKKQKKYQ
jgi:hypothetical protein